MRGLAIISLLLAAAPAWAKWDYCYYSDPPENVSEYPEMPPRSFGFGYAALPFAFKQLCGHAAADEAAHLRRIVKTYLECEVESDVGREIETGLNATDARLIQNYFDSEEKPDGPEWDAVCVTAQSASIKWLAFGDTWYFDGPTPGQDRARLDALLAALNDLTAAMK